jgi:hypothetical protein
MSVNRSVQAAQRRRAGPSNNEPSIPGRTPQPSINSAQMFANQPKSGSGPNITVRRLAGQQEVMNQKQGQANDKLSSVSKMTIAQAITLITLRLGAVETKLLNMPESSSINISGETSVEPFLFQNVVSRLETLEKRSTSTSGSASTPELNLIKLQLDKIKQVTFQNKNSNANLIKENNLLKTQIDELNTQLLDMKVLLESLEKITFENSQQILNLSMKTTTDDGEFTEFNNQNLDELQNDELQNDELQNDELQNDELQNDELQNDELEENLSYDNEQNEFIGTDLKKMIESELNLAM